MTTYTTIPDGDIDQDSPVTQPLMAALRDNLAAAFEAAEGAPKLNFFALGDCAAGNTSRIENLSLVTANDTYQDAKAIYTFYQSGTIRITFDHRTTNAPFDTSSARVLIGGLQIAEWTEVNGNFVERSVDATVSKGESVIIQLKGTRDNGELKNARIKDNDETPIWPLPYPGWSMT